MKKIVFTGGGTGGHIMPNLAIMESLKNWEIHYIGSSGMEKNILKKYKNVTFHEIPTVKFERKFTPKNLLIPFKLIKSISYTKEILKKINPAIIFSKGGYVSIPTCIAGFKLQLPVITHESDLTIGLANKIIGSKAQYLCCSFQETAENYKRNAIFTGSPIRPKILNGNKKTILQRHTANFCKPTILIVGGSLGAQAINKIIWNNISFLCSKYTIIHIVGKNKRNPNITHNDYIQIEFAEDIENYFAISDLVITRAGSNTIFELLSICKPMLLIPLSKQVSRGDQILNAQNFEKKGFATVLMQEDLNITSLTKKIEETFINKFKFQSNMKKASYFNGNQKIIQLITETSEKKHATKQKT